MAFQKAASAQVKSEDAANAQADCRQIHCQSFKYLDFMVELFQFGSPTLTVYQHNMAAHTMEYSPIAAHFARLLKPGGCGSGSRKGTRYPIDVGHLTLAEVARMSVFG